jgi:glutathione S-transferase
LLGPQGTPWQIDEAEVDDLPLPIREYRQQLLDRAFGQYVMRIYETERNARVDWRGC